MTNDHREYIDEVRDSRTGQLRAILAGIDPETGEEDYDAAQDARDTFALDIEVWVIIGLDGPEMDRARVEITLGLGGPTTWVAVDLGRERGTFHHSWGKVRTRDNYGREHDRDEIDLYGDDLALWIAYATECAEAFG